MNILLQRQKERKADRLRKEAEKTNSVEAKKGPRQRAGDSPLRRLMNKNKAGQQVKVQQPEIGDLAEYQAYVDGILDRVKGLDIDDKNPIKAEAITQLKPFVRQYLEEGRNYPNSVTVWVAIWLWDLGDIEPAVNLTLHLIEQNQRMPSRFDSDMPTFICDQIYDWANVKLQKEEGAAPYLGQVIDGMESGKWVVHEVPKGKVYAMAAKHAAKAGNSADVVRYASKALEINESAGVKKILKDHQALLSDNNLTA